MTPNQQQTLAKITVKFTEFGLSFKPLPEISVGPILTVYRFLPINKTKISEMESKAEDLAMILGVESVVVKRLPGETAVAVFVPNSPEERTYVKFQDCVTALFSSPKELSKTTQSESSLVLSQILYKEIYKVPLLLGIDHLGNKFIDDLSQLPHLLIAGTTGSGKSTLLSSLIAGMIYAKPSSELKLILADTKGVEFSNFSKSSHVLSKPVSIYEVLEQMDYLISETELRLKMFSKIEGIKKIDDYNDMWMKREQPHNKIPHIVFVIDELADLLDNKTKIDHNGGSNGGDSGQEGQGSRTSISKIASDYLGKIVQKSRASGIHVIAATQRPSVNIVQGSIKANFPARLTFRLPSRHDSQTVINTEGAEHLMSKGDMLYISPNRPGITRLHAPIATNVEIQAAVEAASYR